MQKLYIMQRKAKNNIMNAITNHLIETAENHLAEFSNHNILSKYWGELSVILKGSTARGNTDQYSDLDFVLFCRETVKQQIVFDYKKRRVD